MRYIIAATVFALTAGITLGFVVSRGLDGSASAAPPTQAVEEQNLDGNGFIAVHEQGVADVNVTNLPPSGGNVTVVADGVTIASGATFISATVDTADCSGLVVFIDSNVSGSMRPFLQLSADGTVVSGKIGQIIGFASGTSTVSYYSIGGGFPLVAPTVAVELRNQSSITANVNKAWLFCSP